MRRRVIPRDAKRMMKGMGLGMNEVPDVQQVILQTSSKEIIIEKPQVALIEMQGQRIYQVTGGKAIEKKLEREEGVTIPEEDIRLVADQSGRSMEEAKRALEEAEGDLAKAILLLQA